MKRPGWWADVDPVTWDTEQSRQEAKVFAARQVVGFLLNVPSDSADAQRVREWTTPEDYPGVLSQIVRTVWDDYDGDVGALAVRMIAAGYGQRIGNGVLLSDLYWQASLAGLEEAVFILVCAREQEQRIARARAELERLT